MLVVPFGVGGYLLWDHRRKAAARAEASADRLQAILGATTHVPSPAATGPVAVPTPALAPAAPVEGATPYAARDRLLTPPQTLLYLLLKTGLPEYYIFAHVALRAVLDAKPGVTGYLRNEHTRRLSWHAVDFVVCDRSSRPIAVVELARADEPDDTAAQRQSWIGAAGLRYLSFEPTALPRKDALRALVLGEASADAAEPQMTQGVAP